MKPSQVLGAYFLYLVSAMIGAGLAQHPNLIPVFLTVVTIIAFILFVRAHLKKSLKTFNHRNRKAPVRIAKRRIEA